MCNIQLYVKALKVAWVINANNTGTAIIVQQDNDSIECDSDTQLSAATI